MKLRSITDFIAGLILGLLLLSPWMLPVIPAKAQQLGSIYCSQNVQYDSNAATSTRIFTAGTGPRQVFICAYIINVGATATNVQFQSGTGSNCGTGTQNITPNFVLPIAGQIKEDSPVFRGLLVPAGKDICIVPSAGNPVQAILYYSYQ